MRLSLSPNKFIKYFFPGVELGYLGQGNGVQSSIEMYRIENKQEATFLCDTNVIQQDCIISIYAYQKIAKPVNKKRQSQKIRYNVRIWKKEKKRTENLNFNSPLF